ncbi:helix-turn-helix domain-containing protein [Paenibacillus donghaensis]|uniref:PucR C-terminal helix-turn-helix domain-containing protein n=1 Tax=Paenibacillus donghaensis TaxID=414771 RepID=A0A2Z2KQ06_9BACL|nr:hypothetical protein B9T62_37010 [Paenibacillus donghaensis]
MRLIQSEQETDGELAKTLRCYINHNHNQKATTRELHIHRSTLIYRMNKIEQQINLKAEDFHEKARSNSVRCISAHYECSRNLLGGRKH